MIPLQDQEVIRQRFQEELKGPVKIDFFTRRPSAVFVPGREECPLCPQTRELLDDVARLSPQVDLRVHDFGADRALEERYGIERVPATVVRGAINRPVVYYGFPTGNVFPVLLETTVMASGAPPELAPLVRRRLKRLKRRVRVRVYVAPTAPYCTEQALLAAVLGLGNQHIRAEIVEVLEFPELARAHDIHAVPATVIDDKPALLGLIEPEKLVDAIARAEEHETLTTSRLITATGSETSTPLPPPPAREEPGAVRPSGLIIPGR